MEHEEGGEGGREYKAAEVSEEEEDEVEGMNEIKSKQKTHTRDFPRTRFFNSLIEVPGGAREES